MAVNFVDYSQAFNDCRWLIDLWDLSRASVFLFCLGTKEQAAVMMDWTGLVPQGLRTSILPSFLPSSHWCPPPLFSSLSLSLCVWWQCGANYKINYLFCDSTLQAFINFPDPNDDFFFTEDRMTFSNIIHFFHFLIALLTEKCLLSKIKHCTQYGSVSYSG